MPEGAVYVGRPTKWGNQWDAKILGRDVAVAMFRAHWEAYLASDPSVYKWLASEIGGKDLACWCRLSQPCHADVLLELANKATSTHLSLIHI